MVESDFNRVFTQNLKISTRSIPVKRLLSERNLNRINYKPYYQRNYVWDNVKATFFIESILLGTDIPPLIFFKSGKKVEVIDGRQRFETLKRFMENKFKLSGNGLLQLKALKGLKYDSLQEEVVETFLDTKVRIFEFEVLNEPKLSAQLEDKIKKEIFRRYNTGITPINSMELDNAKYDNDPLTAVIKSFLAEDVQLTEDILKCFFSNQRSERASTLLTDFIRRYITLPLFPISTYAGSSDRTYLRELLYDFITGGIEDHEEYFADFVRNIKKVISIHKSLSSNQSLDNKLIYECLLWAITVCSKEDIEVEVDDSLLSTLKLHYLENIGCYSLVDAHYYKQIFDRFEDTSSLFADLYSVDLKRYLRDENFQYRVRKLKQTEEEGLLQMNALTRLRSLKPDPSSEPIDGVVSDLGSKRYILRPTYQRQERITVTKASSIIESILLGVYLPPIFIYKNKNGIREVIDGQQRLLSILGYMGEAYLDEDGEEQFSNNNNFSLKGLKILKDFNGTKYSDLPEHLQEKILDFDLSLIEIDSKLNEDFNPVDLFIRLNNKPYPIGENSFEMWNSTVHYDVIKEIKKVTDQHKDWFFLRVLSSKTSDRMDNEEMITVLAYLDYLEVYTGNSIKGIGFYQKQDRLNCRISNKAGLTNFLNTLSDSPAERYDFISSIKNTERFIEKVALVLSANNDVASDKSAKITELFNVKGTTLFKRSLQDIYILWMALQPIDEEVIEVRRTDIFNDIQLLLRVLKNTNEEKVGDTYLENFKSMIEEIQNKYKSS